MTDASSAEFATEKLLYQARGSATAFVHTTIACRKERGSTVGDYVAFFGRQFVPGRSWTKQELRPRTRSRWAAR